MIKAVKKSQRGHDHAEEHLPEMEGHPRLVMSKNVRKCTGEKKVLQQAETDTVHKTHQQSKKKIKVFWDCKYSSLQESLLLKDPVPQSSSQWAGSARTQTPLMAKVRVQRGLKDAAAC